MANKRRLNVVCLLTLLIGLTILASMAQAQSNSRRRSKIIKLDDVKVEGKVAGPEAVFVINKKDLQFEGLEPKKSFIPLIIKSVEKEPF